MRRCRAVSNEWEDLKQKGAKREDAVGVAEEKEKIRWGVKRQEDV